MSKTIVIRRYEQNDKEGIINLMAIVFGQDKLDKRRQLWDWQYDNNPNNFDGRPSILVADKGKEIVGVICGLPVKLKVSTQIIPAFWIIDNMSHPDHRGTGFRLAAKSKELSSLIIGFPNKQAYEVVKRMKGWNFEVAPLYKALIVLNLGNVIRSKINLGPLLKISDLVWKFINYRPRSRHSFVSVHEVGSFGEWADKLWSDISSQHEIIAVRKQDFLNWRFSSFPDRKYTIFLAKKNGTASGYLVVRIKNKDNIYYGCLVDFLADKNDRQTIQELIDAAVTHFKQRNVSIISFLLPTTKEIQKCFRKFGFIFRRQIIMGGYNNLSFEDADYLKKSENWFVTQADSDIDIT